MTTEDRYATDICYYVDDNQGNSTSWAYFDRPHMGQRVLPFDGTIVFCMDSAMTRLPDIADHPFDLIIGTDSNTQLSVVYNSVKVVDDKGNVIKSNTDPDVEIDFLYLVGNEFYCDSILPMNLRYGDLNYDGRINAMDSSMLMSYMTGSANFSTLQSYLADINGDGRVNARDLTLLNGLITG